MIFLEKVSEQNICQIHQIQKIVFKKLYNKYKDSRSPFNEPESSLLKKYHQATNPFLLIKKDEKTIGYARVITNHTQTSARIAPIGIIPQYEKQGYGATAMFLLEKEFSTVKEWHLETILQETALTHFYSKIGYKETGQTESIQKNMDMIYFIKKLN